LPGQIILPENFKCLPEKFSVLAKNQHLLPEKNPSYRQVNLSWRKIRARWRPCDSRWQAGGPSCRLNGPSCRKNLRSFPDRDPRWRAGRGDKAPVRSVWGQEAKNPASQTKRRDLYSKKAIMEINPSLSA